MKLEPSIETIIAADVLRAAIDEGRELIPYDELSAAMNKNAQADGYGFVKVARRMVEKEKQCVLTAEPGVGIKVAKPNEVVNVMGGGMEHATRTHRRVIRCGTTLTPIEKQSELGHDGKRLWHSRMTRAALHLHFDRPSSIKKLNSALAKNDIKGVPAPKELLALITDQPRKKRTAESSPAHIEVPGSW